MYLIAKCLSEAYILKNKSNCPSQSGADFLKSFVKTKLTLIFGTNEPRVSLSVFL